MSVSFSRRLHAAAASLLTSALLLTGCVPQRPDNVIQFSTWGSPEEMAILRPLVQRFEQQHPGTRVEIMHIPDKYFQKMHALLAANLAPDVMFVNNINFPIYASNEAFRDLEPQLKQSSRLKAEDFYPQTLDGFRWKGQLQGLPRDASNLVVFYNRELFDKAGLAYPSANWTLDQFVETARKLTVDANADGKPEQFGMSFQNYFLFWFPYVWSEGGDIFNPDRSQFALNSPAAIAGLQRHADLRHKHHVAPTSAEAGSSTMSQLFMQGKLAMVLNGRWAVPLYRQNLDFAWDIAPFPQGPAGSVVDADASGWVVSKQARNPELAWKLVEFLASREASEAFTEPGLIVPARKDVARSDVFLTPGQAPANASAFITALENGKPMPTVPYWNAIMDEVTQALEPVWEGQKSAAEAVKGLDERVQRLL
ncbi:MAG: ABC transporter substrate-binding protein [Candidatus Sericytochromatia bacterium]